MSTIYNDCEVIIKVNDNNGGKFTKPIAVQGESQHGMDDPEFHANLLGQALYKIQQSGAQTTLKDDENYAQPTRLDLSDEGERAPECTCNFYAMRSGVDTCSCADITTPEDCPEEYREKEKCPFLGVQSLVRVNPRRIITDEGQQEPPAGEPAALPPGEDETKQDKLPKQDKKKSGKKPGKRKET